MAKNLASKLRTGAMIGLAGLALGATAPKANATIAPEFTTTISAYGTDQDLTRDGIQIRYDWTVKNLSPPATSFTKDAIFKYTISANLEERGMYGFTNNASPWSSSVDSSENYSWLANLTNSAPIRLNEINTFSAFIDQDQIIGNEQVTSTATANTGSFSSMVTVPIPEPATIALLASGALTALGIRRVKENYKYK